MVEVVVVELEVGGWKVAVNGTSNGVGSTTGRLLARMDEKDAPVVTLMAPVAWITWLAPGSRVPVNTLFPEATSTALTQQLPLAVTMTS